MGGTQMMHLAKTLTALAILSTLLAASPLPDDDPATEADYTRRLRTAYRDFRAAAAGVLNGRNALEFALARLPEVDPARIYCAGHSSAGTLSLLLAQHEPRLKACIAYAPATDVELRLSELAQDPAAQLLLPGVRDFLKRASPKTHADQFHCPVFLFHARDDSNEPFETTAAFAQRLGQLQVPVTFSPAQRGNHYQSMIDEGIPRAIEWLGQLP